MLGKRMTDEQIELLKGLIRAAHSQERGPTHEWATLMFERVLAGWLDELLGFWADHRRLSAENDELRRRLAMIEHALRCDTITGE